AAQHVANSKVDVSHVVGRVVVAELGVRPLPALDPELTAGSDRGRRGDVRMPPVMTRDGLIRHRLRLVHAEHDFRHSNSSRTNRSRWCPLPPAVTLFRRRGLRHPVQARILPVAGRGPGVPGVLEPGPRGTGAANSCWVAVNGIFLLLLANVNAEIRHIGPTWLNSIIMLLVDIGYLFSLDNHRPHRAHKCLLSH